MYGCTAFPWIGPGRTSATWTVRSSRFSGFVRRRLCICARLSIWNAPTVSARWMSAKTSSSSKGIRERSITSPCVRAICSTQSSTAESIPRPSRSILRKPRRRRSPCPTGRAGGRPSPRAARERARSAGASRRSSRPGAGRHAGEPRNLPCQPGEGAPTLGAELAFAVRELLELLSHPPRVPAV